MWRVRLDAGDARLRALLSPQEQLRADAFAFALLRDRYTTAHGMLRWILGYYSEQLPSSLVFTAGPFGKPALGNGDATNLRFNLSHSGNMALVGVALADEIGVDVEHWNDRFGVAELAPRVFSRAEYLALRTLDAESALREGFYAAWTRKEAYMKATGHGITRGFDHFDVTLLPGVPAALLADRLDVTATSAWRMQSLDAGAGYSAAVVVAARVSDILLVDAPAGAAHGSP